ncbi:MAG: Crp/Fnr family transcriptional regulator [Bryocella sp.]
MMHPVSNLLLRALPVELRASLLAQMQEVDLPLSTSIYAPQETPKYAHFMTSGITSIVTFMADGDGCEVGLVGPEGLVEVFHLLGPLPVPTTAFVQLAGTALRMPYAELKKEFQSNDVLREVVLRLVQGQSSMVSQIAACNRLHEVEQRLARWLLMVSDRVESSKFYLTQEFLAEMIGAQRSTVTLAAGALQRSGLIEYRRGHIQILERPKLEGAACECYPIVKKLAENLYA